MNGGEETGVPEAGGVDFDLGGCGPSRGDGARAPGRAVPFAAEGACGPEEWPAGGPADVRHVVLRVHGSGGMQVCLGLVRAGDRAAALVEAQRVFGWADEYEFLEVGGYVLLGVFPET